MKTLEVDRLSNTSLYEPLRNSQSRQNSIHTTRAAKDIITMPKHTEPLSELVNVMACIFTFNITNIGSQLCKLSPSTVDHLLTTSRQSSNPHKIRAALLRIATLKEYWMLAALKELVNKWYVNDMLEKAGFSRKARKLLLTSCSKKRFQESADELDRLHWRRKFDEVAVRQTVRRMVME
jgi:hypothetical protein